MLTAEKKVLARKRRHIRIRRNVHGTEVRLRLCVLKTLKHIYAQIIDDDKGITLVSASTIDTELKGKMNGSGNIEAAKIVGITIAERAISKDIKKVVFDRGGYIYHGRIKALAEAAREKGLLF